MARPKKTDKQLANVGGKRGAAEIKKKTLAKEFINNIEKCIESSGNYPELLLKLPLEISKVAKEKYDKLKLDCIKYSVLFKNINEEELAVLSWQMAKRDQFLIESDKNPFMTVENGSQKFIKESLESVQFDKLDKSIIKKLGEFGLTPKSAADLIHKVNTIPSNEVIDDKTAVANKDDDFQSQLGAHKVKAPQ